MWVLFYTLKEIYGGLLFTNVHKNYIHLYNERMTTSDECFELISNELSRLVLGPYKTKHLKSIIEYSK